jgi:N-methylhydantoinase A
MDAGIQARDITTTRSVDVRFAGQGHELQISLEGLGWPHVRSEDVLQRFRAEYQRLNAVAGPDAPAELITWRASARGPVPELPLRPNGAGQADGGRSRRPVYFGAAHGYVDTTVLRRGALQAGEVVSGPALVELGDATITVGPGAHASMRDDGLVQITLTY